MPPPRMSRSKVPSVSASTVRFMLATKENRCRGVCPVIFGRRGLIVPPGQPGWKGGLLPARFPDIILGNQFMREGKSDETALGGSAGRRRGGRLGRGPDPVPPGGQAGRVHQAGGLPRRLPRGEPGRR